MLLNHVSEKISSSSSATLMVNPVNQQVIPIAEISSPASMGLFYVEAEMSISNELQEFCVLECSGCKQKKRTKNRKDFECPKCNRKTTLMPRCIFQIDLTDGTASTTASISGVLGEKLLSMTAEDIFGITCVKKQLLPIKHVHEMLSNKLFQIQLRKSSWGNSNNTNTTLSVLFFVEKEQTFPPSTTERNSKKIKPLEIIDIEMQATTTEPDSSSGKLKFEPPTPIKKV